MCNTTRGLCLSELLCFAVDVSLPEVSKDELPQRLQDFLQREDEKFQSEVKQHTDEQVLFSVVLFIVT